ncbi:MAG: choice-of-anchor J domain-containing protein [Bacteroidales bacterium]|nr:choice-of-anchor J domain-containing protein [Bacteroidales bacterium]
MKKVLLFVLAAIFACYTSNAQVLINEGFENGIPNTWTTIDNDGDGNNWSDGATILPTWEDDPATYANSGSNMAFSMSYDNATYTSYTCDNYLITPQIAIPASGGTLTYFACSIGGTTYPDSYCVKLSTTGNAVADFTVELQATDNAPASWTMVSIDLAAYAGQNVYIAFVHNGDDQLALMLDDVKVYSFTSTPEITLNSVALPSYAFAGEGFEVGGTILNVCQNPLTSFNVTYNVDGGAESESFSVTGINVAAGETYEFTHNVQAVIATGGTHTVNVTVSNPNGTADNTADNTNSASITIYDCTTAISEFPYTQDFEEGIIPTCWRNPENEFSAWNNAAYYIQNYGPETYYGMPFEAHTGSNSLISAADTNIAVNWLISPAITIPNDAPAVGFKFFDYLSYDPDNAGSTSYSVMVSTTGTDEADFTTTLATFTVSQNAFTERIVDLAAYAGQTIYVAFKHTTNAWLILDDFSIEVASNTPEIALTSLNIPSMVSVGESFNVSGVITNNSGVAITSFKVQYTVNGTASEVYTVTGQNVAYGATGNFTHNVPASVAEAGNATISVTVSEPNGTADNTADNTLTSTVAVCGVVSTLPYTESFENGLGCWTAISNNTENENVDDDGFGVISDFPYGGHDGNSCFVFSSFTEATDYTQYLISPELNLTDACNLTFYYTQRSNTYPESCVVMVSSTTNDPASFSQIGEEIVAEDIAGTWTEATFNIPANTKYIAFKYTSDYAWFMAIDDITLNSGTATINYTITVLSDNTNMGTVSGGGSFAEGSTTTITATANNGYRFVHWNDNNTDNPRTITVTGNATYTAFFEATTPSDPSDPTQGIDDVNAASVKLYPNPTSGNLYVEVEGLQKVEIIDAVGRVVLSQNNGTVNMSALANGIYTVRVSANGTTSIKKVVKK